MKRNPPDIVYRKHRTGRVPADGFYLLLRPPLPGGFAPGEVRYFMRHDRPADPWVRMPEEEQHG